MPARAMPSMKVSVHRGADAEGEEVGGTQMFPDQLKDWGSTST